MKAYKDYATYLENTGLKLKVNHQYLVKYASRPYNTPKAAWLIQWKVVEYQGGLSFKDLIKSNDLNEVVIELQDLGSKTSKSRLDVELNTRVVDYNLDIINITTRTHIM